MSHRISTSTCTCRARRNDKHQQDCTTFSLACTTSTSTWRRKHWKKSLILSIVLSFSVHVSFADAKRPGKDSTKTTCTASVDFHSSNNGDDLRDWVRARCDDCRGDDGNNNNGGVAIWVYEGALFDPLEGRRIANVEGVELVRCIANVGPSSNPKHKQEFKERCGDLEVVPLVTHPNATFDRVLTILSRKLFCYQSPDNPHKLLSSIRVRPNSPLRRIPTNQAVAVYDTATTFIARRRRRRGGGGNATTTSTSTDNNSENGEEEILAHTEWPDRQSIWGMASRNYMHHPQPNGGSDANHDNDDTGIVFGNSKNTKNNSNNPHRTAAASSSSSSSSSMMMTDPYDFTIYARQKSASKKPEQLFDLTKPSSAAPMLLLDNKNSGASNSPRRAKLIEFGTSSSRGKDKFGARETYSYTNVLVSPASNAAAAAETTSAVAAALTSPFQRLYEKIMPTSSSTRTSTNNKQQTPPPPPTIRLRYSRYGEGPPFFGPGRICTLELQGRRVSSLDDIPPLTSSLIAERMSPLFLEPVTFKNDDNNNNNDDNHNRNYNNIVEWFRSQGPALQIRPTDNEPQDFWLPDYVRNRSKIAWKKLQRGTLRHRNK